MNDSRYFRGLDPSSFQEEMHDVLTETSEPAPDEEYNDSGYRTIVKTLSYKYTREAIVKWIKKRPYVLVPGRSANGQAPLRRVYWVGQHYQQFLNMLLSTGWMWNIYGDLSVVLDNELYHVSRDQFRLFFWTPRDLYLFLKKSPGIDGCNGDVITYDFLLTHFNPHNNFKLHYRNTCGFDLNRPLPSSYLDPLIKIKATIGKFLRMYIKRAYQDLGIEWA